MPEFKNITFDEIPGEEVKTLFPEFFNPHGKFYEIKKAEHPVGFYGVKTIDADTCEISLYLNEGDRDKTSKNMAAACLHYPFQLGFNKVLISTDLLKMYRFLSKMTKLGVNYLFKSSDFYWFEVNK